jgi:hypothetical protein
MLFNPTTSSPATAGHPLVDGVRRVLLRRLWLPKAVYEGLPWLYLGAGFGALVSGLLLPEPSWIVGYLLLVGIGLVHAGLVISALRRRSRRHLQRRQGTASAD